jgi:hypothetical protein
MTTTALSPTPVQRFFDNGGAPLAFGQLFTYSAGSSTPAVTYVDSFGFQPNTNPIILNARGEANIWLPPNVAYKFVLAYSTDSNPPTNPIWTVDHIVNAQLTTLYAGVDTGMANAYVVNFAAPFSALADGIILYFLASSTNTLASTLNVNGLGVSPIVYQTGVALTPGAIVANQFIGVIYRSGSWYLLNAPNVINTLADGTAIAPSLSFATDPQTGLYNLGVGGLGFTVSGVSGGALTALTPLSAVWTGFASAPTGTVKIQTLGNMGILYSQTGISGTSNATGMSITNFPNGLIPGNASSVCMLLNNGVQAAGTVSGGGLSTLTFNLGIAPPSATGFTASGTKGLPSGFIALWPLA